MQIEKYLKAYKELKPTEWTEVDKLTETKKDDKSQASIQ